jgi:hypothetical protein
MKGFYYYIYIFTLLKLKNQIKLQLTNIEQYIFIWIYPFGVRLHLCISSVKCCRFVITGGRFVITGGRFASYFHCESIVWKFTHLSILIINYTRIEILVDRCLSFFCWSLYCLSFDLPILIYRFVSSNSSYKHYQNDMFFI